MANTITLADFFSRHDFVRCNNLWDIIRNEEHNPESWEYCNISDDEFFEPYNYWVTSMSRGDCRYYNNTYGLKFIYCDTLDIWVFVNDICCGTAYEDCKLKPIEEQDND